MNRILLISLLLVFGNLLNAEAHAKLALVYDGPGSCTGVGILGCSNAAEAAAESAGFQVLHVKPDALTSTSTEADYQTLFKNASVWIQPGGTSTTFVNTATPQLKSAIVRFVSEGGGYVGFCAGAFAAYSIVGTTDVPGLGIFPGGSAPFVDEMIDLFFDEVTSHFNGDAYNNHIYEVNWSGKNRFVYFEEGPRLYFSADDLKEVEVTAVLKNGDPISARTHFGKGRVYITGLHPEAPHGWRTYPFLTDPDGLDYDLVGNMLNWASGDTTTEKTVTVNPEPTTSPSVAGKYLGLVANYTTTSVKPGNSKINPIGTTTLQTTSFDANSDTYEISITNTDAVTGVSAVTTAHLQSSEFDLQFSGSMFTNCIANYGALETNGVCKLSSSNSEVYFGTVPFGIVKTVSTALDGTVFTTQ